jgi:hypothetical protein
VRAAQKLLGEPTIGGGSARAGVVLKRVKGVKYAPMPPRMYKNSEKTGSFEHFVAYKLPKMLFFAKKYLTRYTPETFFEESINFKIFRYLSDFGVMSVQSFGSDIHPQPPRLRLKLSPEKVP